jgi:hydrogenase nickel incorporation protein HypA/HybF
MHELSIAMSIVEIAEQEAKQRNARVSAVHLKLGMLSGVVKDALMFSYGVACDGTLLEGSNLVIEEVPVEVFCDRCQANRKLASAQWFACPECGTATPIVVHGKELEITGMEVVT